MRVHSFSRRPESPIGDRSGRVRAELGGGIPKVAIDAVRRMPSGAGGVWRFLCRIGTGAFLIGFGLGFAWSSPSAATSRPDRIPFPEATRRQFSQPDRA